MRNRLKRGIKIHLVLGEKDPFLVQFFMTWSLLDLSFFPLFEKDQGNKELQNLSFFLQAMKSVRTDKLEKERMYFLPVLYIWN